MPETLARKRYTGRKPKVASSSPRVFTCANCRGLSDTVRSHSITCGNACRVALHRHAERLEHWQNYAEMADVPIQALLDASALRELLPDKAEEVLRGSTTIEALRDEIYQAYMGRVMELAHLLQEQENSECPNNRNSKNPASPSV